jgi:hypothetical protein
LEARFDHVDSGELGALESLTKGEAMNAKLTDKKLVVRAREIDAVKSARHDPHFLDLRTIATMDGTAAADVEPRLGDVVKFGFLQVVERMYGHATYSPSPGATYTQPWTVITPCRDVDHKERSPFYSLSMITSHGPALNSQKREMLAKLEDRPGGRKIPLYHEGAALLDLCLHIEFKTWVAIESVDPESHNKNPKLVLLHQWNTVMNISYVVDHQPHMTSKVASAATGKIDAVDAGFMQMMYDGPSANESNIEQGSHSTPEWDQYLKVKATTRKETDPNILYIT